MWWTCAFFYAGEDARWVYAMLGEYYASDPFYDFELQTWNLDYYTTYTTSVTSKYEDAFPKCGTGSGAGTNCRVKIARAR